MLRIRPSTVLSFLLGLALLLGAPLLRAQGVPTGAPALPATVLAQALEQARLQAGVAEGARIEVLPGELDARLKLAPCARIEPYLPSGSRPWGKTRVGLRCTSGPVAWNVYLPMTVKVWAPAVVTVQALPADQPLVAADLRLAEVDLAEAPAAAYTRVEDLLGRRLARPLPAGATLRADAVRARVWFAAGETVTVSSAGPGFRITSEAQALGPGVEGQTVRLRTESGRLLSAWPTGERRAEVKL